MTTTHLPVIAVTGYSDMADRGAWGMSKVYGVTANYVDEVVKAGGLAVVVPAREDFTEQMADDLLDRVDGVVLTGGDDIDASLFGQENHPLADPAKDGRDPAELAIARRAIARDIPVLGVCRGMQVLAVAAGGTLEQHLPDRADVDDHAQVKGGYWRNTVRTVEGTRLRALYGDEAEVPCHHHQGVAQHPGFVANAWADKGVLEGIEMPGRRFCLGIQSHPESGGDDRLFAALVEAARGEGPDSERS